ncbi:uncharacterized protein LOC134705998 [Mytilus trossulus]|uniref:uncharacterized protein LOC134705998 n=1 Tax=Mytilus trossulus TaxID=6551 RepID=UPI003007A30F
MTQEIADKLNVKPDRKETLNISAFGNSDKNVRHMNKATVYLEADSGEKIPLQVLIVPAIAAPIQNNRRYISHQLHYFKGLKLAHPLSEDNSFDISLLIGADHYWDVIKDDIVRGDGPTAMNSKIGYLLSGPLTRTRGQRNSHMMHILSSHTKEDYDIERFRKLESLRIQENDKLNTEKQNIKEFSSTSIAYEDGKYVAQLPWIEECPELPTNEMIARARTHRVVNRLNQESNLFKRYHGYIIKEQERRGFIEKAKEKEDEPQRIHFIPHHPVKNKILPTRDKFK